MKIMNAWARAGVLALSSLLFACNESSQQPTQAQEDMPALRDAQSKASVEMILQQFINASIHRRHEEYYDLLSARDQAATSKAEYLKQQMNLQPNLADRYFDRIEYRIEALSIEGEKASAQVIYQFPDVESMIKQVYNLAILGNNALPPLDEMKQQMDLAYQDKPLPMKSRTRSFTLLHEQGQWRVYLGWDVQASN